MRDIPDSGKLLGAGGICELEAEMAKGIFSLLLCRTKKYSVKMFVVKLKALFRLE